MNTAGASARLAQEAEAAWQGKIEQDRRVTMARLHTLTYWVSECLDDASAYNIRAATRREVVAQKAALHNPYSYGPPTRVTVTYTGALDLLIQCLDEGAAYWEPIGDV